MQKNIGSQKWTVFAFNKTNNTPLEGDANQITAEISKDGAPGGGNITDTNPTELEDGYYVFDITAGESNADLLTILPESSTGDIQVIGVPGSIYTTEANRNKLSVDSNGRTEPSATAWEALIEKMFTFDASGSYGDTPGSLVDEIVDNAASQTWDYSPRVLTANTNFNDLTAGEVENAVWDAVLTGASHDDPTSAGKKLRQVSHATVLREEEQAQGGSASTITLHNDASAIDGFYDDAEVIITGDTGIGQARHIHAYNGGTRVASITPDWTTDPDNTSDYVIMSDSEKHVHEMDTDALSADSVSSGAVDKIWAKAMSDLAGIPGANASVLDAVNILFMALRNKQTATSAAQTLRNDAGAEIATAALSDGAGTTTKDKYV